MFHGHEYQREFAPGLILKLTPNDSGWFIGVVPNAPCKSNDDWAAVITSPYRGYNALDLDSSYGITAKEAVAISPRKLKFLLTCDDYKRESRRLEIVLSPYSYSDEVYDDALAKLGTSRAGAITLTILQSKISPAGEEVEGRNYGKIDWLRFKVDVSLPTRNRPTKK